MSSPARPSTPPFNSCSFATPKAKEFFTHFLEADRDKTALRLEVYSSTGLFNVLERDKKKRKKKSMILMIKYRVQKILGLFSSNF